MKSICTIVSSLFFVIPFINAQEFAAPQVNPFSLTQQGSRCSPALADLENDGDLDLLTGMVSGDYGLFENIGAPNWPSFGTFFIKPGNIGPIGGNATPFLVDLDNDGDFDVFSGGDGGLRYFENIGNETVYAYGPEIQSPFSIISPGGICKPYMTDIDDDGDMDLFVGATDGNIYFYENTGTANTPSFALSVTNPFGLADVGLRSAPAFADIDSDGDMDALIGTKDGDHYYFENIGTSNTPLFNFINLNPFNLQSVGDDAKPYFGDLDDDGDLDLMVGNANGDYIYFENISTFGIGDLDNANVSIYPNPFTEFTRIQISGMDDNEWNLIITDVIGKVVVRTNSFNGDEKIIVHKEMVGRGMFLAYLESNNKMLFLGKLICKE